MISLFIRVGALTDLAAMASKGFNQAFSISKVGTVDEHDDSFTDLVS